MNQKTRIHDSGPSKRFLGIRVPANRFWIVYPVTAFAALIVGFMLILLVFGRDLPSLVELERASDPLLSSKIISADGKVIKELFAQKRVVVPLSRVPEHLIQAVIATEDQRFYQHWGLDFKRVVKSAIVDVLTLRKKEGASTLTSQLSRQLYLNTQKVWSRKIRESLTALQIERTYSKPEIMEMYLNQMCFGHGMYGVEAASQLYFDKHVEELTLGESALLVGILQRPAAFSPYDHPESALARRNLVLRLMLGCKFLTQSAYDSLSVQELGVVTQHSDADGIAPDFCEYVRQQMYKKYGVRLYTDGLNIYTTLDTRVQACADSAIRSKLPEVERRIHSRLARQGALQNWVRSLTKNSEEMYEFLADTSQVDSLMAAKATVQTALVSLEPWSGHILAMVGSRKFDWFNRAVQARRQPGSSFKPIVYTAAVDNGYPATTELLNQPVVITQMDGTKWSPGNFDGSTGGPTTFREAIRRSLNMVTARLVQELITPSQVVSYAKLFGLSTPFYPYDAIALGIFEVIPMELISAYSVFANNGIKADPISILRVEDKDGHVLEETMPKRHEVISEQTAYIMTDMLKSTMRFGGTGQTARSLYGFNRPAAGKTGTTNDYTDAWFIGFTPQIVTGVWVGLDNPKISLGDRQTGAMVALPIWAPFMRMVYDTLQLPLVDFTMPPGIVRVKICAESKKLATGGCPDTYDEVFTTATAPKETCPIHGADGERKDTRKRIAY
jgi:penicillin-binding protein 1A